jgi:hypothetical protein
MRVSQATLKMLADCGDKSATRSLAIYLARKQSFAKVGMEVSIYWENDLTGFMIMENPEDKEPPTLRFRKTDTQYSHQPHIATVIHGI